MDTLASVVFVAVGCVFVYGCVYLMLRWREHHFSEQVIEFVREKANESR